MIETHLIGPESFKNRGTEMERELEQKSNLPVTGRCRHFIYFYYCYCDYCLSGESNAMSFNMQCFYEMINVFNDWGIMCSSVNSFSGRIFYNCIC